MSFSHAAGDRHSHSRLRRSAVLGWLLIVLPIVLAVEQTRQHQLTENPFAPRAQRPGHNQRQAAPVLPDDGDHHADNGLLGNDAPADFERALGGVTEQQLSTNPPPADGVAVIEAAGSDPSTAADPDSRPLHVELSEQLQALGPLRSEVAEDTPEATWTLPPGYRWRVPAQVLDAFELSDGDMQLRLKHPLDYETHRMIELDIVDAHGTRSLYAIRVSDVDEPPVAVSPPTRLVAEIGRPVPAVPFEDPDTADGPSESPTQPQMRLVAPDGKVAADPADDYPIPRQWAAATATGIYYLPAMDGGSEQILLQIPIDVRPPLIEADFVDVAGMAINGQSLRLLVQFVPSKPLSPAAVVTSPDEDSNRQAVLGASLARFQLSTRSDTSSDRPIAIEVAVQGQPELLTVALETPGELRPQLWRNQIPLSPHLRGSLDGALMQLYRRLPPAVMADALERQIASDQEQRSQTDSTAATPSPPGDSAEARPPAVSVSPARAPKLFGRLLERSRLPERWSTESLNETFRLSGILLDVALALPETDEQVTIRRDVRSALQTLHDVAKALVQLDSFTGDDRGAEVILAEPLIVSDVDPSTERRTYRAIDRLTIAVRYRAAAMPDALEERIAAWLARYDRL